MRSVFYNLKAESRFCQKLTIFIFSKMGRAAVLIHLMWINSPQLTLTLFFNFIHYTTASVLSNTKMRISVPVTKNIYFKMQFQVSCPNR